MTTIAPTRPPERIGRPPRSMRSTTVSLRLTSDEAMVLRAASAVLGISVSDVIRLRVFGPQYREEDA